MATIIIGSDHAGFDLKEAIKAYLAEKGYGLYDQGAHSKDPVDYPVIAKKVALKVASSGNIGILVCGTGIGMCMAANKVRGERAALCYDEETAKLAREHNNANILCLGSRTEPSKFFKKIIRAFLAAKFSDEERHHKRVQQIE